MFEFELIQENVPVALVSAPSREEGLREIQHYAMVYGQDGPVEIREVKEHEWTTIKK